MPLLTAARSVFLPHRTLVCAADGDAAAALGLDPELTHGRTAAADGAARAYVCRGSTCQLPVADADALRATLRRALAAG